MSNGDLATSPEPPLWDQHAALPLSDRADVGELARYRRPRGSYVSVNAGYAPHSTDDVLRLLSSFRQQIAADDRLALVATTADIDEANALGKVAVAFDLEDSGPLDGDLARVRQFYDLGVRTMLPSYNYRNAAGGGCLDAYDEGLTSYGRSLVREMNAVGMVVDGSHCGRRTALNLGEISERPVIYSHSCMRAVWDHPRNITDEQARACAATDGVIGITGVGIFLGPNDASLEAFVRHVDHAVEVVGPEHVGLSTDYPFDVDDFNRELRVNRHLFSDWFTRWGPIAFLPPERLMGIAAALRGRGYPTEAVQAICGGNFRRVADAVWAQ